MSPVVAGAVGAVFAVFGPIRLVIPLIVICPALGVTLAVFKPRVGISFFVVSACVCAGLYSRADAQVGNHSALLPPGSIHEIHGTVVATIPHERSATVLVETHEVSSEFVTARVTTTIAVRFRTGAPPVNGDVVHLSSADGSDIRDDPGLHVVKPARLNRWRSRVQAELSARILAVAGDHAGLLTALVFGSRSLLPVRTEELFRRAGLSHVLALSGMHLLILVGATVWVLKWLLDRRIAVFIGSMIALAFVLLVGARPSLLRAFIMCQLSLLAALLDRRIRIIETLSLSLVLHLFLQPQAVHQLSFQLSYLALLGIGVLIGPLSRAAGPWVPRQVLGPIAAGVSAQIAGAPLLLLEFGVIYPAGIVAGLVAGPLVALLMLLGITTAAVGHLGPLARVLEPVVMLVGDLLDTVVWFFAGVRGIGHHRAAWPAALVSCIILLLAILGERRRSGLLKS